MQFQDIQKRKVKQGDEDDEDIAITESDDKDDGKILIEDKKSDILRASLHNSETKLKEKDHSFDQKSVGSLVE